MSTPVRTSTSGPFLLVGLVLSSVLCLACLVVPVLWIVEDLANPDAEYAGLGLVIGAISLVLLAVPALLLVVAWVLAARARAAVAGWLVLVASFALVLAAPVAAGQTARGWLVLLATVVPLVAGGCAVTALVRGRRAAVGR